MAIQHAISSVTPKIIHLARPVSASVRGRGGLRATHDLAPPFGNSQTGMTVMEPHSLPYDLVFDLLSLMGARALATTCKSWRDCFLEEPVQEV